MHRTWWFAWVEVAVLAVALFFVFRTGLNYVQEALSPYVTELEEGQEPQAPESSNIVTDLVGKVQDSLHVEINYEDLIFDYANDYATRMMEESRQERNAVTEHLR